LFVWYDLADCKYWNEAVGVFAIILAREFSLFWLSKPIAKELAEKERPLINRVIAQKSTASF